jgi:molybdopterin molybdotransferase
MENSNGKSPMNKDTPVNIDCDSQPDLLSVEDALLRIQSIIEPVSETRTLGLMDALHHVLAEDVISPINVPPYKNSAMDGYAVKGSDLPQTDATELKVIGTSFAGTPFAGTVNDGECIRIMTGAKMPEGADTVIMQEHVVREEDSIRIVAGHSAGQNVRHAGEDIQQGGVVLKPGKYIGPAELGLLASLGVAEVSVKRKIKVAFFSTGDELRPVGEKLEEGQIYDSNRYTLFGMLSELGVEFIDLGVIKDDPQAVEDAFIKASSMADAVFTSGGVSVGDADYIKQTLDKIGQVDFWRIRMKPGKPLAVGKINNAVFFGLPGNPVSVMATFYIFALPALKRLMGQTDTSQTTFKIPCKSGLKKRPGRTDFQRGTMYRDENGEMVVEGAGMQASHILSGMSKANCFIILPAESGNIEPGERVEVLPFEGMK